jgi:hypothetical protein
MQDITVQGSIPEKPLPLANATLSLFFIAFILRNNSGLTKQRLSHPMVLSLTASLLPPSPRFARNGLKRYFVEVGLNLDSAVALLACIRLVDNSPREWNNVQKLKEASQKRAEKTSQVLLALPLWESLLQPCRRSTPGRRKRTCQRPSSRTASEAAARDESLKAARRAWYPRSERRSRPNWRPRSERRTPRNGLERRGRMKRESGR